jgi:hypothetical protein
MSLFVRCKHRITIERNAGTATDAGDVPPRWTVRYANVRCLFVPAGEPVVNRFSGQMVRSPAHVILYDETLDVEHSDRVVYDDEAWRITGISGNRIDLERWE